MAIPHEPKRYDLLILPSARRQLRQFQNRHHKQAENLIAGIVSLSDNPRPSNARKLVNREEWRLRVGDYRALFLIDDQKQTITITAIAHRRDIYR
ncbi:MAG TPA: type II toxin-antitoxin system RelE/ParE family toxin [Pyrinomonadaceae bacterium]|nr:type II toxin-antitoxin system RelE/ParE family toxin [Pyrinomonadaceae bacterium]